MKKSIFLICLAALVLTSCENFLKGSNVRNELEEVIEIANASPITFIVTADEGSGTLKTLTLQLKKKNTFDLVFEPADTYRFIKWEVLDRTTKEPVEGILKFDDETNPETKGIAIAPREGLEIHAKCVLQPAVVSVNPSPQGQNQVNAAIRIKFNMPLNDSAVDNVSLTCFGQKMDDYFEKPVLNAAKDELTIRPKTSAFITFIDNLKKGFADIRVSLPSSITALIDGEPVPLYQNANASFDFHYILMNDNNPPFPIDYYLSRSFETPSASMKHVAKFHENIVLIGEEDTEGEMCTSSNFNTKNSTDAILDNVSGEYIYIYGKYRENESAIAKIRVYEQFCGNQGNWYFDQPFMAEEYNIDDDNVFNYIDSENNTIFCIKHAMQSQDGAVRISVEVEDAYGNTTDSSKEISVFKMATIPFIDQNQYEFGNECQIVPFNEERYNTKLKTLEFNSAEDDIVFLPYYSSMDIPEDYYSVKCEYKCSDNQSYEKDFTPEGGYYWTITLDKAERMSGIKISICISDKFGNVREKQYDIPKSEDYVGLQTPDVNDPENKANIYLYYRTGESIGNIEQLIYNNGALSWSDYEYYAGTSFFAYMDKDVTYKFIPCAGFDFIEGVPRTTVFTEIPDYTYSMTSSTENPDAVDLINYDTDLPYRITKNTKNELLDIKVQIAENSNQKYDQIILMVEKWGFVMGHYDETLGRFAPIDWKDKYETYFKNPATGKFNTEYSITAVTECMFENPTVVHVFGMKDGICSTDNSFTIPQLTYSNTEYDNYNDCYLGSYSDNVTVDCDTAIVSFSDLQTGISTIHSYIIQGDDVYNQYGKNMNSSILTELYGDGRYYNKAELASIGNLYNGIIEIPRWMFTDTGFSYYFADRAGNVQAGAIQANNSQLYWILGLITEESEKNTQKSKIKVSAQETWGSKVTPEKVIIYKWDKEDENSNPKWIQVSDIDWNTPNENLLQVTTHYPANKFIKVVIKLPDKKSKPWNRFTYPEYIYTGASNSGTKDYIYPAYNGTIAINSDAPVLARTVVTSADYEECKNWSVSKWENGKKYIKEEVLSCDGISHAYYKIYDNERDIAGATCYAVIVHFADGTKAMSQIMQK